VEVSLEIVPSSVELIERMMGGGVSADLLCPPDYAVRELRSLGRLHELDHSLLPNLENLEPRFRSGRPHDPDSRVSMVKDWGTTGFMFRTDLIDQEPGSWTDFWELASKFSGRVSVLDSPGEVIGAALKMRGYSYNAASAAELAGVREDLLNLKAHLFGFDTDYKPLLASGQVCLSLGWNGDAAVLIAQGVPIKYVIPREGSQIWEDDWAISADAPSPEVAHQFLNFVLRPDVAEQEARFTGYATANHAARERLDPGIRNDPATYPSEDTLQKLEAGMPLDAEGQGRREELWQLVRS
jgi:spermidine/putrescine transport system substrate-binding protein